MRCGQFIVKAVILTALIFFLSCKQTIFQPGSDKFASFTVNPQTSNVELFWRDDDGRAFKSIQSLKSYAEKKGQRLRFAMNGGMFEAGNFPKGLFVQNQQTLVPLDNQDGDGNFYLKPNGVFYLTVDNRAFVTVTEDFKNTGDVKFATQSGPMLLINGEINNQFKKDSANLNLRNGVGVLPDGKIAFVITRQETNFYELAQYFQNLGCREALYLDGFVSRMYLPEKDFKQLDGDFAVIIAVTE